LLRNSNFIQKDFFNKINSKGANRVLVATKSVFLILQNNSRWKAGVCQIEFAEKHNAKIVKK
jgi:hypothetical protein